LPDQIKGFQKLKLTTFRGDKSKYRKFKAEFFAIFKSPMLSDAERVLQLVSHLEDVALREVTSGIGNEYNTRSYVNAWNTLELYYGGTKAARTDHLSKVYSFAPMYNCSEAEIKRLRSLLLEVKAALMEVNNITELNDENALTFYGIKRKISQTILGKFTEWRSQVFQYSWNRNCLLGLLEWATFLLLSKRDCEEGIPDRLEKQTVYPEIKVLQQKVSSSTPLALDAETTSRSFSKPCPLCTEIHSLRFCKKFKEKSVPDRIVYASSINYCHRCLNSTQHATKDCPWRGSELCPVTGCTERHNPLVHTVN
jgi:hypothetical protein